MNRFFGFSRNAIAVVAILVAIILVVLVGLIIIGSAAIRALMVPGLKIEGVSILALLVTIIVLLAAVFFMLLVLFSCCCKHGRTGKEGTLPPDILATLVPFLSLLPQMRNTLRDVGIALYASGRTIQWMHDRMSTAATSIDAVANDADNTSNKIMAKVFPNFLAEEQINPLASIVSNLRNVADHLNPANSYPLALGTNNLDVPEVVEALVNAGKALAKTADALGASPPPPAELLTQP
jgi:hypothetical protein